MAHEYEIVARTIIAMAVAFAGAAVAVSLKKVSHFTLCAMISVAAGALFAVTVLHIVPESLGMLTVMELGLGLFSGYLLFFLISRYVSHICPACAATHVEERFMGVSILMIAAISLHSTMDGVGVAVSQSRGQGGYSTAMFLAISIHKLPEGLALASVGRAAGYSRTKAFGIACAVESTTLIGGLASIFLLGNLSLFWMGILMAHIGGGFIYLTIHAMLGEMIKHERRSILIYAFVGFMLILMASIGLLVLGAVG